LTAERDLPGKFVPGKHSHHWWYEIILLPGSPISRQRDRPRL
jgi:hypothetical protein